ncbi:hypothetical protein SELMODRAFT_123773 [Selaginella moellendorffii]|uniref:Calcineurin-like phosphoesterase domain-containing protein n=1 Tax=Selaginella moellendorffii TaxID=88036 RepID=D8SSM8_SELML|nr:hypothetical protein SELMODRAFT_123773 [Selaginella moellendorffii]
MQASLCAPRFVALDFGVCSYHARASSTLHFKSSWGLLAAIGLSKNTRFIAASARQGIHTDGKEPPTMISAPERRIVAVGDLHGDLRQTKRALRVAGVLSDDEQDNWTGGTTVLVQVGDILDRGPDEIAILSLLWHLTEQARSKGGAVFQVHGNHETMNVSHEFNDTPDCGFEDSQHFVDYCNERHDGHWHTAFVQWRLEWPEWKKSRFESSTWLPFWNVFKVRKKMDARVLLFSPGGPLALELSRHGVVLKINDWLFAHGGLLPHHVAYGLEKMNSEVSNWMKGGAYNGKQPFIATKGFDSIVWSRLYSRKTKEIPQPKVSMEFACAVLQQTLDAVKAKGLVIGHTPQVNGANSECDGKVWRIDVGMSRGVLNATPQVIEIVGDEVKVLSCQKEDSH